jgi:hypothetical protein
MLHIMSVELVDLTGFSAPIGQEEFDRAKNQLRSGIHPFRPAFAHGAILLPIMRGTEPGCHYSQASS